MPLQFLVSLFLLFNSEVVFAEILYKPYTHYDIQVTLDTNKHALVGLQTVEYTNKSNRALNEVYFVLAANHSREKNPYIHDIQNDRFFWNGWEPKSTTISYVNDANGDPLNYKLEKAPAIFQTYSLDEVLLKIQLPQPLPAGDKVVLNMGFSTTFPENKIGDEAHWQGVYTWRFGWNPVELSMLDDEWYTDGFRMIPGYFDVKLQIPTHFKLAAGADEKKITKETGQTKTYELKTSVPQLSVPFTAGPRLSKITDTFDNIQIQSLYKAGHQNTAQMITKLSKEILSYYQPRFGNYRYQHLVVSEISAPLTAFASDGLVLMSENFYRYKDLMVTGLLNRIMEYVLAHEIGHLWWGIAAAPDFAQENWLSEAFANYLAYTYMEDKYGATQNLFEYDRPGITMPILRFLIGDHSFRQQSESAYLNVFHLGWDEEIAKDPRDIEYGNIQSALIYEKGYWILRALENEIGREDLFKVLNKTFEQYQGKPLSIQQFQAVCETVSGKSLDWFFKQWVFGKASLDLSVEDVESIRQDGNYVTEVTVKTSGDAVASSQVVAETQQGQIITRPIIVNDQKAQVLEIQSESEVVKVQVDPQQKIPDTYRINNTWPRPVKTHFGLYDDPLDAYSVRYYVLPSSVYIPAKGTASGGLVLGVSGGYSPTHQWSVAVTTGFEKEKNYLSTTANYNYRFNARNSLVTVFDATGYDSKKFQNGVYTAELGQQHIRYETPNVGSSSRILLPSNIFLNKLVFQDYEGWYQHEDYQQYADEYNGTLTLWRFSYTRDDTLRYTWQNLIDLDVALPGINEESFYKTQINSIKRFRLMPNWILRLSALAGYASEETPTPEKFDFLQFKSYFGEHFRRSTGALYADLDFPLQRELEVSIFNLFSLKAIYGNFFSSAGAIGSNLYDTDAVQTAESGAQLKFVFTSIGGFADISFNVGYVVPWYRQNTVEDPDSSLFIALDLFTPL